jgi:hypothetical protein
MGKKENFLTWIVNRLLKNTFVSKLDMIDFDTPQGVRYHMGEVTFYGDSIEVMYGIPDDWETIKKIEFTYKNILLDLDLDYGMYPNTFKEGESVYDHIMRNTPNGMVFESTDKKEKYINFIVDDLVKKTIIEKLENPNGSLHRYGVSCGILWNGGRSSREIKESVGGWAFKNLESIYGITREDFRGLISRYVISINNRIDTGSRTIKDF